MALFKQHTFPGQTIIRGGMYCRMSVTCQCFSAKLIREKQDIIHDTVPHFLVIIGSRDRMQPERSG